MNIWKILKQIWLHKELSTYFHQKIHIILNILNLATNEIINII